MQTEKIKYSEFGNCIKIANKQIELIVTLDVGPRVVRFGFIGGKNEFAEFPEHSKLTKDGKFHLYGGHRLWAGPEKIGWTDYPDNFPVELKEENNEIVLTSQIEKTGLQKIIRLSIDNNINKVTATHVIINQSNQAVTLAPWSLSVMASGGRAIIPQEPFISHADRVLPVRPMVMWGYTQMQDTRWTWGNKYIQLQQDVNQTESQKLGVQISEGWAAYVNSDCVFIKRFSFNANESYPDFGCNAEFYTNSKMLEIESLGHLVTLNKGESTSHTEQWFLFNNVKVGKTDNDIDTAIKPLLKQTEK